MQGIEKEKGEPCKDSPLVGVSGFEPEASWTRTKRDTKLRHTPMPKYYIDSSLQSQSFFSPSGHLNRSQAK